MLTTSVSILRVGSAGMPDREWTRNSWRSNFRPAARLHPLGASANQYRWFELAPEGAVPEFIAGTGYAPDAVPQYNPYTNKRE